MRIGALTHPGLVREKNEDYYSIVKNKKEEPIAVVIADGMGGHNSGEVASFLAVDTIAQGLNLRLDKLKSSLDIDDLLIRVVNEANGKVYNEAQSNSNNSGMGTTVSCAVFCSASLNIAHVGDSRAYRYRNNCFEQITTDHSYIQELLASGSITKEEARTHPRRNIITRALGNSEGVLPDLYKVDFQKGDILLMCTDGLTNKLDDEEISSVLGFPNEPDLICARLIEMANEKGGEDNITVIVVKN